jgi:cyclic pyranopterin phosphate synthase
LTHLDAQGRVRMVDVSGKTASERVAVAQAVVELGPELRARMLAGEVAKGDALAVARIAGIQAAKDTARLLPLCHALPLASVAIAIEPHGDGALRIEATARCFGPTGVEMEALTAATVAALALYDMGKSARRGIRIGSVELLHKAGGRSGTWHREGAP